MISFQNYIIFLKIFKYKVKESPFKISFLLNRNLIERESNNGRMFFKMHFNALLNNLIKHNEVLALNNTVGVYIKCNIQLTNDHESNCTEKLHYLHICSFRHVLSLCIHGRVSVWKYSLTFNMPSNHCNYVKIYTKHQIPCHISRSLVYHGNLVGI